jgi:hypothetical protein
MKSIFKKFLTIFVLLILFDNIITKTTRKRVNTEVDASRQVHLTRAIMSMRTDFLKKFFLGRVFTTNDYNPKLDWDNTIHDTAKRIIQLCPPEDNPLATHQDRQDYRTNKKINEAKEIYGEIVIYKDINYQFDSWFADMKIPSKRCDKSDTTAYNSKQCKELKKSMKSYNPLVDFTKLASLTPKMDISLLSDYFQMINSKTSKFACAMKKCNYKKESLNYSKYVHICLFDVGLKANDNFLEFAD